MLERAGYVLYRALVNNCASVIIKTQHRHLTSSTSVTIIKINFAARRVLHDGTQDSRLEIAIINLCIAIIQVGTNQKMMMLQGILKTRPKASVHHQVHQRIQIRLNTLTLMGTSMCNYCQSHQSVCRRLNLSKQLDH